MKEDIAKKWTAALRSGKYTQMRHVLASGDRKQHCCLGVLCELAIKDGVELPEAVLDWTALWGGMPSKVRRWAGMETCTGQYGRDSSLAILNDDGSTFDEIADVIDLVWEKL